MLCARSLVTLLVVSVVVVSTAMFWSTPAEAFGRGTVSQSYTLGSCTVRMQRNSNNNANVRLIRGGTTQYAAGGVYRGRWRGGSQPITIGFLNGCFANAFAASLQQRRSGSRFGLATYLGFSFCSDTFYYEFALVGRNSGNPQVSQRAIRNGICPNTAPTAEAGAGTSVQSGDTVQLNGTASVPGPNNPDINQSADRLVSYSWSANAGSFNNPNAAQPVFTPPALLVGDPDQTVTATLTVTDGRGVSRSDTMTITVTAPPNQAPTANAGLDQSVGSAATVTLNGSGSSDPDPGHLLTHAWSQTGGPAVTLSDASAESPTFTAPALMVGDADVTLTFSLVVTDPLGLSSTADSVTITVTAPPNQAPAADAGPDQSVGSAATVTLNGSGSSDPDPGQLLTHAWSQTGGPAVTLSDASAESPTFTAPALVAGDADVTLTFSLVVTDALGLSSAADSVTITVLSGPTVTLVGGPPSITNIDPFTVTVTFSKAVTGFDSPENDVMVTNGSAIAISGGPTTYALTIAPTGAGDVSIAVPAGSAQDSLGTGNAASNTLAFQSDIVEITRQRIAGFMLGRANNLASNQPDLTRFLRGSGCGDFSATATDGSGSGNGCASLNNAWIEITGAWSNGDRYALGSVGSHVQLTPNLMVGGMFQFDHAEDSVHEASGQGWLAGPYFVAKLPEQPIYVDGRVLYGKTDNEIAPLGTYTDSFDSDRWLAKLGVSGEYMLQGAILTPLLDFTYVEDQQNAYADGLGNTIPAQTVSITQMTTGLDFEVPVDVEMGNLSLRGGVSGIYSASDGASAAPAFEQWRGRVHLGLNYDSGWGAVVDLGAFYDGIGSDLESFGSSLSIHISF